MQKDCYDIYVIGPACNCKLDISFQASSGGSAGRVRLMQACEDRTRIILNGKEPFEFFYYDIHRNHRTLPTINYQEFNFVDYVKERDFFEFCAEECPE